MLEPLPISEVAFPPIVTEPLDPAWDLGVAAQHIVLTRFRQLLEQRQVVWDNADLEGVHEIRVAARRTRTALQTLSVLWDETSLRRFERYLERFATEFGVARDLDVMIIYLREQLEQAAGERAAALSWLLERNVERRAAEQTNLMKVLQQFERDSFPAAFVAYFSGLPVDLWALGAGHG
jgi:CHAD domain-containing protein